MLGRVGTAARGAAPRVVVRRFREEELAAFRG
jgi:hypothetical protein